MSTTQKLFYDVHNFSFRDGHFQTCIRRVISLWHGCATTFFISKKQSYGLIASLSYLQDKISHKTNMSLSKKPWLICNQLGAEEQPLITAGKHEFLDKTKGKIEKCWLW